MIGAWRSLVAHLLWEQRVAGSNPAAPTIEATVRSQGALMLARIFRPAQNAMQSGTANTREWVLAFAPGAPRLPDPLMGWTQTTDTEGQVRLTFDSLDEAVSYAERYGIVFEVLPEPEKKKIVKAYADNFAYGRKIPWTH
jgi:ETC complex I subunit conserved region